MDIRKFVVMTTKFRTNDDVPIDITITGTATFESASTIYSDMMAASVDVAQNTAQQQGKTIAGTAIVLHFSIHQDS